MSDVIGKTCPYCQTPIKPGESVYFVQPAVYPITSSVGMRGWVGLGLKIE